MHLHAYGAASEFEAADVETPRAEAGQVLVRIAASSVNTVDTMIRKMGRDLPLSPEAPAIPRIMVSDFMTRNRTLSIGERTF